MRVENMITTSLNTMTEGWRRGDGSLFAQPFSQNARFVAFDGSIHNGPADIAAFHQRAFDTILKGTLLELIVDTMKQIDKTAWLVFSKAWHRPSDTSSGGPKAESANVFVFKVYKNKVEVLAFQNTRIRPILDQASAERWRTFDASWDGSKQ